MRPFVALPVYVFQFLHFYILRSRTREDVYSHTNNISLALDLCHVIKQLRFVLSSFSFFSSLLSCCITAYIDMTDTHAIHVAREYIYTKAMSAPTRLNCTCVRYCYTISTRTVRGVLVFFLLLTVRND